MTDREAIRILQQMRGGGDEWDEALEYASDILKSREILKYIDGVSDFWREQMPMNTMEEMGELIQAISKLERYIHRYMSGYNPEEYMERMDAVETEIADVIIAVLALSHWYNMDQADILKKMEKKLDVKY